jgi:hypothetical protein
MSTNLVKACEGKWQKSMINGIDDGVIDITELPGGYLTGTHGNSQRQIIGQCGGGDEPHISFIRLGMDRCFYLYDGDTERVVELGVEKLIIRRGTVTIWCPGPFDKNNLGERVVQVTDDDWTAEKVT